MKIILGGVSQTTPEGSTVNITRSMSDPVPTCKLSLKDNTSSIFPQAMQELLILDDQMVPNPTINMAQNPSLNPYTTNWTVSSFTGFTYSQAGGGGINVTVSTSTAIPTTDLVLQQSTSTGSIVPNQKYVLSVFVQGSNTPTNIGAALSVGWMTASGGLITSTSTTGAIPAPTTPTRVSFVVTAPATASAANLGVGIQLANGTNSGTVTLTQVQFEPLWFPTLSYPTPWVGPSQTNAQQLPSGLWIRQYRKFAGFVNHVTYDNYHGNVRTVNIDAVGYAWLMSLVICNNTYASQADSAIISNLLSTYFPGMFSITNVVTGVTLSSFGSNWDDVRTLFDNLASQIGYYWTVDYYWSVIYAPPGYFSMPINLICDNSSNPDLVTNFPAYNFSAEMDYTQPGSVALVIGSGSNVAEVIDPNTTATNGFTAGYSFKAGSMFMRKINDSTLQSVNDCTQRGMAELLQYDYPRYIYHLTTNVELVPGQSIQVTSNTDNLNQSTQLIQQVSASWIGTSETLTNTWEYKADLGAVNRSVAHIISRIHRITQRNSSAPAISTTTLAVIEQLGFTDSGATSSTLATGYAPTILADGPIAYYRLNNLEGTVVDDYSGNGFAGTTHGSPTLGATTLLTDASDSGSDKAMTFASASSQYVSLPTSLVPTGAAHAWSLECWCNISSLPASSAYYGLVAMGNNSTGQSAQLKVKNNAGTGIFVLSTFNGDINSGAISTATIYHVVGTYDGTNIRLYVNGALVAGPSAFALNLVASYASLAADGTAVSEYYNGTLDEAAIYNYALNSTQVSAHYAAGRP